MTGIRATKFVSAADFDIVRSAFRTSVAEGVIAESDWFQHAKELLKEMTGHDNLSDEIINRIVGRPTSTDTA